MINDIYEVILEEFAGLDAVYEDAIIELIGTYGLNLLIQHRLLESCGVINERQLYVINNADKK